jgi:Flp pilus assembly pilin Flp
VPRSETIRKPLYAIQRLHMIADREGVQRLERCSGTRKPANGSPDCSYLRIWLDLKYDRRAAKALEYCLIAAAIILVCAGSFFALGTSLRSQLSTVQGLFPNGG